MTSHVIVIGGSDSSGGAGLSRDVATLAELGREARPVLTAVTAQTHRAVAAITLMDPQLVARQLIAAFETGPVGAVKIGMLGNGAIVAAIAKVLAQYRPVPVVIDPVIASSSGRRLLSDDGLEALKHILIPLCRVVTPNLPEASILTGTDLAACAQDVEAQARVLQSYGAQFALIKGGHGEGAEAIDWLFGGPAPHRLSAPRLPVTLRGTGCTLAAAIAAYLADDQTTRRSCSLAKDFLSKKLRRRVT
ncbi:bifunctional hydroxymethylpyrimidine kinase/phosphomethylpyrimidine kinase [Pelagibacterium halotolerans]|uniref:bifunctional hydroxymethylpyrimidine kinase/phosphomethylpyrimidine kinase n=1 Tax=Pelagibacterium halotolerans TaxID=531813 RepID=UPI00384A9EFE